MPLTHDEAMLLLLWALDTFSMEHHRSVAAAVDGITLVHNDLWRRLLSQMQTPGFLDKMLTAKCPCAYCSGRGGDVRADHADAIESHRKNHHRAMLAQELYTPVNVHRDWGSVENMLENLELERRAETESDDDSELANIDWDGKRAQGRTCKFL